MDEKATLLSVVTEPDGNVVYIHADLSGLMKLRESIDRMIGALKRGECDHDHLMSEDWAGYELTATILDSECTKGCRQVHHVKLYAWNDEWKAKHGL